MVLFAGTLEYKQQRRWVHCIAVWVKAFSAECEAHNFYVPLQKNTRECLVYNFICVYRLVCHVVIRFLELFFFDEDTVEVLDTEEASLDEDSNDENGNVCYSGHL